MNKIATHDSGSGEKSKNFLFALGKIFAQTQTKTIVEQWNIGVRYFDIRVDNKFVIAHGLWKANKDIWDILNDLNYLAATDTNNKTYYRVTIEGNYKNTDALINNIINIISEYKHIHCTQINKKLPKWECVKSYIKLPCAMDYISVPTPKEYFTLHFKDWKRYIPIPKLLNRIYKRKHEFNNKMFTMVDFI